MFFSKIYRYWLRNFLCKFQILNDDVLIVSRSMNDTLFNMSQQLISLPYQRIKVSGTRSSQKGAADYLHLLFEFPVKWVINIDEDCFTFDNSKLTQLLTYMKENKYDFCGIPEGGTCLHRKYNPVVLNPFFNIFNVERIRPVIREDTIFNINHSVFTQDMKKFTPSHLLKSDISYTYDGTPEYFYGIFFWLLKNNFRPLYLPSYELEDGVTTVLCNNLEEPFLYHTWYSRKYSTDNFHKERIDSLFKKALQGGKGD